MLLMTSVSITFPRNLEMYCLLLSPLNEMGRRGSDNSFIFVHRNFQDTSLNWGILCGPKRVTGQVSCLSPSWTKREQIHEIVASTLAVTEDQKFWKFPVQWKDLRCLAIFHTDMWHWEAAHLTIFSSLPSWKMSLNSNKMNLHHSLVHKQAEGKNRLWCPLLVPSGIPPGHKGTCWNRAQSTET